MKKLTMTSKGRLMFGTRLNRENLPLEEDIEAITPTANGQGAVLI